LFGITPKKKPSEQEGSNTNCSIVLGSHSNPLHDAYRKAYCDLFDRRKKSYESAIGEIKNAPNGDHWKLKVPA